jgi:DNA-binding NtrC family response regulator
MLNRHRVLVISRNDELRNDLVTLISSYGYFVEDFANRLEAIRRFRAHKQSIIIIDIPSLRRFSKRIFNLIRNIQQNAIILVAAHKPENRIAFEHLSMGAYDVLRLPLKTESLIHTLNRAQSHHRMLIDNMFVKNLLFFGLLMIPLWLLTAYLLIK